MNRDLEQLRYEIDVLVRYHDRRRAWFDGWQRWTTFVGILGGSAAAVAFYAQAKSWSDFGVQIGLWVALGVAILNALDLTFGFAVAARRHDDLYKRLIGLDAEIVEYGNQVDETQLRHWIASKYKIEADQPSLYNALYALCDIEVARIWGRNQPVRPPTSLERLAAHLVRMKSEDFI